VLPYFNLYQSALHWAWDSEAWILVLAVLLIHFVLNLGQVTKISGFWAFFQCWMCILFCSLAFWCSFEPHRVRGESLVSDQCWGRLRLLLGHTLGSDLSDIILVLSFLNNNAPWHKSLKRTAVQGRKGSLILSWRPQNERRDTSQNMNKAGKYFYNMFFLI